MDVNKLCPFCLCETDMSGGTCSKCGRSLNEEQEITHHLKPFSILQGKYLVGGILGEGGFGITYVGLDINLEIKVAIKEFYPNGYCTRDGRLTSQITAYTGENLDVVTKWRDNFIKEARALAKCADLPGVVGVKDFFQENNTAYIVQEFLDGVTLKEVIKESGGKIAPERLFPAMEPVLSALSKVHEQGIIHRDISPDNIMGLYNGQMKLIDFGAARDYSQGGDKSLSVLLKPGYAPEEQYRTKGKQGPWSDVYALAATIYKCLTGVTPPEALERIRVDELVPPSKLGIKIEPYREAALLKAMAVVAEDRYQTVEEFKKALYDPNSYVQSNYQSANQTAQQNVQQSMKQPVQKSAQQAVKPSVKQPAPKSGKSLLPLFIAGGAVLVALIAVIAVLVVKKIGNAGLDILRKESSDVSENSAEALTDDYEISVHENAGNDTADSQVYDAAESDYSYEIAEDSTNEDSGNEYSADMVPWAATYKEYVTKHYTADYNFAYIYVNDDDIPELVLQGPDEATGSVILTYKNERAAVLQTARLGFTYRERENLLDNSDGHMGFYYDYIYRITDGSWESVAEGKFYVEDNVGDWDEDDLIYEWNGNIISADEYSELMAETYPAEGAKYVESVYTYDEILAMLDEDIARMNSAQSGMYSESYEEDAYDNSSAEATEIFASDDMRDAVSLVIPCFMGGSSRRIVMKDASASDIERIMYSALASYSDEKFYADYTNDGYAKISKEYADDCARDLLGCSVNWNNMNEIYADDYSVYVMMASGEWQFIANPVRAYQKGQYIYVSGAAMTGNDLDEYYLGDFTVKMKECNSCAFGYTILEADFVKSEEAESSASASSTLASQGNHSYGANHLVDNDVTTAWVEGVTGVGRGESVVIYLKDKMYVSGIKVFNGYHASQELYNKNGRVTDFSCYSSEGKSYSSRFGDIPEVGYTAYFDEVWYTDTITLIIDDAVKGSKYEDTCISEIQVNAVRELSSVD